MLDTIRASFAGYVVLRSEADMGRYHTAVERFASGGSRVELMTTLVGLGVPADQIRYLASYPGQALPAVCCE